MNRSNSLTAFAPPAQFDLSGRSQMTIDNPQVQYQTFSAPSSDGPTAGQAGIGAIADIATRVLNFKAEEKKKKEEEARRKAQEAAAAAANVQAPQPVQMQPAVYRPPVDNIYNPPPMNSVA